MKLYTSLKENKRVSVPRRLLFFDTETTESNRRFRSLNEGVMLYDMTHKLRLGVAKYVELGKELEVKKEIKIVFRNGNELYDFIMRFVKRKRPLWLLAHNIQFDLAATGLLEKFYDNDWETKTFVVSETAVVIQLTKQHNKVKMVDTFNYFRTSVKQLGLQLGKEKMNVDYEKANEKELEIYCERDVDIIKEVFLELVRFWYREQLGNFSATIGGLALKAYRHKFLPSKKIINGHEEWAVQKEAEAYYGGRVECFRLGKIKGEVYRVDVNSMYPYVMKEREYPIVPIAYKQNVSKEWLERIMKDYLVIAKVRVNITEPKVPKRQEGKLLFPVGSFVTYLATPELKLLDFEKEIKEVYEVFVYEKARIFDKFVEFFYRKRLEYKAEGNRVYEYFVKILLNSLSGKFGQKKRVMTKYADAEEKGFELYEVYDIVKKEKLLLYHLGKEVYQVKEEGYVQHANLAIIAHITSYARAYLWKIMKKAGLKNVLYVDTDGLFLTKEGYERVKDLVNKTELGKLKLEAVSKEVTINNLKDYVFGDVKKKKGLRKDAVKIKEDTYKQIQFRKYKSYMRMKEREGAQLREVIKKYKREYMKGIVTSEGVVKPFIFLDDLCMQRRL